MNPFDKVTLELTRKITSLEEENAALKEQVAQLTTWKGTAEGLLRDGRYPELCEELTSLQSKSAALVDAMNKVSMLLCEANPNCSQEYLFGVITGTHTVSEAALAAFKGEK